MMDGDDLEDRVLAHVTRYPDLTVNEIARALGFLYKDGKPMKRRAENLLINLLSDGKVQTEQVPADTARVKRIWRAR